jgi:hypothetical protein
VPDPTMGAGSRDEGGGGAETPLLGSGRRPRPPIFETGIPSGTPKPPMLKGEAPTFTTMPLVGDKMLPVEMPPGATERPPETPGGAVEPPKGTEHGEGGDSRYAAIKAIPKELVGNGVKRPSMSSNPDERMWSGRRSTGMIGDNTLLARQYLSKSGQGLWKS